MFDALTGLVRELPHLVSDRIELLSLELTRAGLALAKMLVLLVAAAILGVTAWFALWSGVVVGLVQAGLHWAWALLIVLLLNLGAAGLALLRLRKLLPVLSLPGTRRHLSFKPSITGAAPPVSPSAAAPQPAPPSPPSAGAQGRSSPVAGPANAV